MVLAYHVGLLLLVTGLSAAIRRAIARVDRLMEGEANCEGCHRDIDSAYGDPDADPEGRLEALAEQEAEAAADRRQCREEG